VNQSVESLSRAQQVVGRFAIEFAPRLLAAALILALGWLVSSWAMRILRKALLRLELEPPVEQLLERILRALMLALVLIIALPQQQVRLLGSAHD
jgi:hypothetical protein